MGKKTPKVPAAPDPVKTTEAQSAANKEAIFDSARINQMGQESPFGRTYFRGGIGTPERTQVVELSPAESRKYNQENQVGFILGDQAIQRAQQLPTSPFSLRGVSPITSQIDASGLPRVDPNNFSADRQRLEDAVYGRMAGRVNEQYARDAEAQRTQLVNQGINVGNEAYSRAERDLTRSRDDALRNALVDAMTQGAAEQQRLIGNQQAIRTQMFGEGVTNANLANSGRQQQISDILLERQQPFNELSAYLQGAPALQAPQAGPVGQYQVAAPDVMGAQGQQYQGALNAYSQQVGARNSKMGSTANLAGTIGAAAILSARSIKQQIGPVDADDILARLETLPIERWEYNGGFAAVNNPGEHIGTYAEDFAAAFGVGNGKEINMVDALGVCMAAIQALTARVKELEHGR